MGPSFEAMRLFQEADTKWIICQKLLEENLKLKRGQKPSHDQHTQKSSLNIERQVLITKNQPQKSKLFNRQLVREVAKLYKREEFNARVLANQNQNLMKNLTQLRLNYKRIVESHKQITKQLESARKELIEFSKVRSQSVQGYPKSADEWRVVSQQISNKVYRYLVRTRYEAPKLIKQVSVSEKTIQSIQTVQKTHRFSEMQRLDYTNQEENLLDLSLAFQNPETIDCRDMGLETKRGQLVTVSSLLDILDL